MAKASSYYSYPPSPHYSSYSPPKQPFPPELLLGLALFATLVLYALGLSWSGVIFHPIYSLRSVAELVQYKLARISDGFADMDWEKVALGIRGEPADDNDDLGVEARERIVRSYRELNQSKPEAGASLGEYYPGLLNAAGNLCFLNATLQSMASTRHLLTYLQRTTSLGLSLSPPVHTPVATALLATLTALNTPHVSYPSPLRPLDLVQALARSSKQRMSLLSSSEQQDAHELWGMIREAVQEELERAEKERDTKADAGLAELLGDVGKRRRRKGGEVKDPFLHLVSQKVKCMACGYTRDVRHTGEEQVMLIVPPVASCSIYDLLGEFTKLDLISDYACRKCSLLATRDKLVAQRDRLALALPPPPPPPSSSPPNAFEIPPPPPPPTAAPAMTQSRKDRRKKVQKLVDRVASAIAAGDFERELGDDIKVERVEGPAGRQVRFARTPEVLTFHINRSSHFGRAGGAFKNPCQVTFPESLDFAPYCDYASPSSPSSSSNTPPSTPQRDLYRLSSLVVHYGSHSFGHYVAFHPSPSPSNSRLEWYRISDETVQPASIGDALRSNPFLMFYERVEAGSSVVKALSAAGYQVRALTRSPSSPSALALAAHAHVTPFAFDITDKGSVERAMDSAEVVFAMPLTDPRRLFSPAGSYVKPEGVLGEVEQGKRLADVAKAAGVKTFFWSTVEFSDEYLKQPNTQGVFPQVYVNPYFKEIGLPHVNLSFGFFNENFINSKSISLESDGKVVYTFPFGKLDAVVHPHFSVGHDLGPIVALLAANFESAKLDGKTITLADRVCSNHQVIDIIHKVTGRTTIFKSSDGYTPAKDSPIEHFGRAMTAVSYLDPSLIPDKTLTDLGFTFRTLEEYVREELVPALGL